MKNITINSFFIVLTALCYGILTAAPRNNTVIIPESSVLIPTPRDARFRFVQAATATIPLLNNNVGIGINPFTQFVVPGNLSLQPISTLAVGIDASDIKIQGRLALITNAGQNPGESTLQIVDISNATEPQTIATLSANDDATAVAVQGHYVYIANQIDNNLQIVDISTPTEPFSVSTTILGSVEPNTIALQGMYAYLTDAANNDLVVVDISDPTLPFIVGAVNVNSQPTALFVEGSYVYVVTLDNNLACIDISNPQLPLLKSIVIIDETPDCIYVQGRYAYVGNADQQTMTIIDLNDPTNPILTGFVYTHFMPNGSSPSSLFAQGRYVYLINLNQTGSTPTTIQVIDVSDPFNPFTIATTTTGINGISIAIQGRYAYIINSTSRTLTVFDLGGAYIQQFEAGGILAGTLETRSNAIINNNLDIRGGLSIGRGAFISGPVGIAAEQGQSSLIITGSDGFNPGDTPACSIANNLPTQPALVISSTQGIFASFNTDDRVIINGFLALPGGVSSIRNTSDERLKVNISEISTQESLEKIRALQPKQFEYCSDYKATNAVPAGMKRSFIAQDFQEVYPELVSSTAHFICGSQTLTNVLSISELGILADVVGALKALDKQCTLQATTIASLQNEIADLRQLLSLYY